MQYVDCSLETALSELILTNTTQIFNLSVIILVFHGLDLSAVIHYRFTAQQFTAAVALSANRCQDSPSVLLERIHIGCFQQG